MYGDGDCAVCGARCRPGLLMCGPDWRKVPLALQTAVYAALRAWDRGAGNLGDLRAAQDAAVTAAGGRPASEL